MSLTSSSGDRQSVQSNPSWFQWGKDIALGAGGVGKEFISSFFEPYAEDAVYAAGVIGKLKTAVTSNIGKAFGNNSYDAFVVAEKKKLAEKIGHEEAASLITALMRRFFDEPIQKDFDGKLPPGVVEWVIYLCLNNLIDEANKNTQAATGPEKVKNAVKVLLDYFHQPLLDAQKRQAELVKMAPQVRQAELKSLFAEPLKEVFDKVYPKEFALPEGKVSSVAQAVLPDAVQNGAVSGVNSLLNKARDFVKPYVLKILENMATTYAEEAFCQKEEAFCQKIDKALAHLDNIPVAESFLNKVVRGLVLPKIRPALLDEQNRLDLAEIAIDTLNKEGKAALGASALEFMQKAIKELSTADEKENSIDKTAIFAGNVIEEAVQRFFVNLAKNNKLCKDSYAPEPQDFLTAGIFTFIASGIAELSLIDKGKEEFLRECNEFRILQEAYKVATAKAQESALMTGVGDWVNMPGYVAAKAAMKAKQKSLVDLFRPLADRLLMQGGMLDEEKKVRSHALPISAKVNEVIVEDLLRNEIVPWLLFRFAKDVVYSPPVPGADSLQGREELVKFSQNIANVGLPLAVSWLKKDRSREMIAEEVSHFLKGNNLDPQEKKALENWLKLFIEDTSVVQPTLLPAVQQKLLPPIILKALEHLAVRGKKGDALNSALSQGILRAMEIVVQMQSRWKNQINAIKNNPTLASTPAVKLRLLAEVRAERDQFKKDVRRFCDPTTPRHEREELQKTLFKQAFSPQGQKPTYFSLLADCGYKSAEDLPVPFLLKPMAWDYITKEMIPQRLLHLYKDIALGDNKPAKCLPEAVRAPFKRALHDLTTKSCAAVRCYLQSSAPDKFVALADLIKILHQHIPKGLIAADRMETIARQLLADETHPLWTVINNYINSYVKSIFTQCVAEEMERNPAVDNVFAAMGNKLAPIIATYLKEHRNALSYTQLVDHVLTALNLGEESQWRIPHALRKEIFSTIVKNFLPATLQANLTKIFSLEGNREVELDTLAELLSHGCSNEQKDKRKALIHEVAGWGAGFVGDFIQTYLKEKKNSDLLAVEVDKLLKKIAPGTASLEDSTLAYLSSALIGLSQGAFSPEMKEFISSLTQAIAAKVACNLVNKVGPDTPLLPANCLIHLTKLVHAKKGVFAPQCEEAIARIRQDRNISENDKDRAIQKALPPFFQPLVNELLDELLPDGQALSPEVWSYLQTQYLPKLASQIYLDTTSWVHSRDKMVLELNKIFSGDVLWRSARPLRNPEEICQYLAEWGITKILPKKLKDKEFTDNLVKTLYGKLPPQIASKIKLAELQKLVSDNSSKLATDSSSPIKAFTKEITAFVEAAIMRGMVGAIGTIDDIEKWYAQNKEGDALQKNYLFAVVGKSLDQVKSNFKMLHEIQEADPHKRNIYDFPHQELYNALKAKGCLHAGVADTATMTKEEQKAHELKFFYEDLAKKLWDIVEYHGADGVPKLQDLPVPQQVRDLLAAEIPKNLLPSMLQEIIGGELEDKQMNKRMFVGIKLLKEGLLNSEADAIPDEDHLRVDPDCHLYKKCGNLAQEVIKSLPLFGLDMFLRIPMIKVASAEALGYRIVKNLGKARTATLVKQILGQIDLKSTDETDKTDEDITKELTSLTTSIGLMIFPTWVKEQTVKIGKKVDTFIDKLGDIFGDSVKKFAVIIKKWIFHIVSKLFNAVYSLLSIPGKPLYPILNWLVGKIYLDRKFRKYIPFARNYAKLFAFSHIDQVVTDYHKALTQMKAGVWEPSSLPHNESILDTLSAKRKIKTKRSGHRSKASA